MTRPATGEYRLTAIAGGLESPTLVVLAYVPEPPDHPAVDRASPENVNAETRTIEGNCAFRGPTLPSAQHAFELIMNPMVGLVRTCWDFLPQFGSPGEVGKYPPLPNEGCVVLGKSADMITNLLTGGG